MNAIFINNTTNYTIKSIKCLYTVLSGGVTAGQFGAMPHLKLKFLPNFQSRLKTFFWNL